MSKQIAVGGGYAILNVAELETRFRMDGIERSPKVVQSWGVTPFSPTGVQYPKHKILLGELISGNDVIFPNVTLTAKEKVKARSTCALHFMLSSSVDLWERGDEDKVCPHEIHLSPLCDP
ncbi:unnamed protein product [Timema podura]|uniref:Uncharacterized protein n=1 Tax=Timema podura TaxID=61482 RepID=A0ABN7P3U4_TIMPD|nr:unnamed protein product [Timema podura]